MRGTLLVGLPWAGLMRWTLSHIVCGASVGLLSAVAWRSCKRERGLLVEVAHERRMREELEAYARLDGAIGPTLTTRNLAKLVCRAVADKSVFRRAAMMVCDAEGKLYVAGSAGMDDLAVAALREWGEEAIPQQRGLGAAAAAKGPMREMVSAQSFLLPLEGPLLRAGRGCKRVIVTMMRAQNGEVIGALAVCPDAIDREWPVTTKEAMPPIEALAARLARSIENTSLSERLMRSEKLAGLGQLAGGVAHELSNPLTAVLGFAELIAETASDPRVRQDSETITREALRMKETVESLLQFWRPAMPLDEPVEIGGLLAELAESCADTLKSRGVALVLQGTEELPALQGNRDRLRQVFQHLLNNSAQAIASSQEGRRATDAKRSGLPRGSDELDKAPEIRVSVRHDGKKMQMIVSDTGPGFPDATRVFDPFYTTRKPGTATGLGLSICYGVVREHGGEISAFNLHPHGAAVVIELPIRPMLKEAQGALPEFTRSDEDLLPGAEARVRRRQDQDVAL